MRRCVTPDSGATAAAVVGIVAAAVLLAAGARIVVRRHQSQWCRSAATTAEQRNAEELVRLTREQARLRFLESFMHLQSSGRSIDEFLADIEPLETPRKSIKLLGEIGRGEHGVVHRAELRQPPQRGGGSAGKQRAADQMRPNTGQMRPNTNRIRLKSHLN